MSGTKPPATGTPPIIVTDSTCDLPPNLFADYAIRLVPLTIQFGQESYRSGVDMDLNQFAERLARGDVHPTTSQPTVHDFAEAFRAVADPEQPILCIAVSGGLSGTVNAARQAAEQLPDRPITIYDSRTISAALGLQVLTAARAARAGYPTERIIPLLDQARHDGDFLFTLEDLSYLVRGGRIGAVRYAVAQTLRVKPVITVSKTGDTEGTYISAGRVRSLEKAVDSFVQHIVASVGKGATLRAMTFHGIGKTPALAAALNDQLRENFNCVLLEQAYSTPVLGVHVGPLALDVGFIAGDWPV